jgi:RNA polymerase sigma-70 factor, ECF subfamily
MTHELPSERLPETPTYGEEDARLTRVDVARALDGLSPTDRLMVRLRYERDMTHSAVAAALGLSVANVKVRLHRLRPKLQEALTSS